MTNKYKIQDILEAVNTILNNSEEKPLKLTKELKEPLKLTNQIKDYKIKLDGVPKDTEKIILQAEKYLKK